MILLVSAPIVKPSEPPAGLSRLCGALNSVGVHCTLWDANLECLLNLLRVQRGFRSKTTTRAQRHLDHHLNLLRTMSGYQNTGRYRRAVSELNHLLASPGREPIARVSLTDYKDPVLSPLKSSDLLHAANTPEKNLFYPFFRGPLCTLLEEKCPSVVGFSLNYLGQALTTFAMIGFLKTRWPSVQIWLGGGLVTSWMRKRNWKNPFSGLVDKMIAGPGENALLSFTVRTDSGLESFAPDFETLPLADYLSPGMILPFSASSGCYWNRCGFCPERAENNPYVMFPPDRVAATLQQLAAKHLPVLIHLLDNALSPTLMERLSLQPPGAPWYGFARITPHLADKDFCMGLRRSGCVMLQLGLESGDQEVLDHESKGISLQTASDVLKTLNATGIATYVYLLFGTPSETPEAAMRTLDYVAAHHQFIDFLNIAVFNLPIESSQAHRLQTSAFSEGDLSLYTGFVHPKGWDRRRIRQFLDKAFKRHPDIAPIVRKDPPSFTSNHAPFFCRSFRSHPGTKAGSTGCPPSRQEG